MLELANPAPGPSRDLGVFFRAASIFMVFVEDASQIL